MSDTAMIAGGQIRSFVERIEQIESEIQDLNDGKKDVFAEAKGEGFDVKVIREIIKLRKQDKDERDEHETLLEALVIEHAGSLGQRDRLPYTEGFDRLAERFNAQTGSSLGARDLWRLIARLAK